METYSVVGKSLPKIDALEKTKGAAKYTADLKLPDMLYGKVLRSPYAHARVIRVDGRQALEVPGVQAVLSAEDLPRKPFTSGGLSVLMEDPRRVVKDQFIFDHRVRFVGDAVAAVAAVSPYAAEEAIERILVEYEELPAVFDPEEAMKPEAPPVHDGVARNIIGHVKMGAGDVEKGFQEADYTLEDRYVTSRQKQCQLEPSVSVALFDGKDRLTIWTPTPMPHLVRQMVADLFDFPLERVRIITLSIGGGFGGRLGMVAEPYAVALSLKTGRPVMVEYTRPEDFFGTETRHPCIINIKMGAKKDGTLTAIQATAVVNTGAYATHGQEVTAVLGGALQRLYRCPNLLFEGFAVYTNTPVAGAYRGYGGPQAIFALESQMDALAEKLGLDPIELRSRNHIRAGDIDPLGRMPVSSCGLGECLRSGAESIGWREKRNASYRERGGHRKRGVGVGCFIWVSGVGKVPGWLERSDATIQMDEKGAICLFTGASDPGTGSRTTLRQIAAEELGVEPEAITLAPADTDITPFDVGSHASRTLYVAGGAVRAAAAHLKQQLLEKASEMLEAAVEDLVVKGGMVGVKGVPQHSIPISEVAGAACAQGKPLTGIAQHVPLNAPPFGAQFAEVEVDTETGRVQVLELVAAHDVGKAINPIIVEGQIEGAIQHGVGYALTEDLQVDPETGRTLNPLWRDYWMPTAVDMPKVRGILVEPIDPTGPFGAKGVGEPGLVPTAAAIANAIYNAVGVRIRDLPITEEKVLRALRGHKASSS